MVGWPSKLPEVDIDCRQHYSFHKDIIICDGLLLKIEKILVAAALRRDMLQQIHRSHLGEDNIHIHLLFTYFDCISIQVDLCHRSC